MLRAVVLAERLEFSIDPAILDAIALHGAEITKASPARMLEEYYKILRSGASERIFRRLAEVDLLRHISPELDEPPRAVWESLEALDDYRRRFTTAPDTLTNPVLIGSLLVPLGMMARRPRRRYEYEEDPVIQGRPPKPPRLALGMLPIARGDVEHLRHILSLQSRLAEFPASLRAQRSLMHRSTFAESMTWMDIHGRYPEAVQHWRELRESTGADIIPDQRPRRRRRRRRRARLSPPE
jgi:poly(A) polymerase